MKRSSWLIVPGSLLALLGEQVWQMRAERAALTQAHQRIQIGDTAEQACQVLQAVRGTTVMSNAQERCAQNAADWPQLLGQLAPDRSHRKPARGRQSNAQRG